VDACKVRLRPILMTSAAFILGVLPLLLGQGAGAEMRQALGLSVVSGMLGVTFFGLLFTPVFYDLVIYWFGESESPSGGASATGPSGATATSAPTTGH
jgi:multidrug efflux pump